MSVSSTSTARSGLSREGRHLGTLVCVVLKAKNLPNKRSIGKQDPYCVLQLGSELNKTKPDKRGGQHPTWDEQLHFEIHEDMEDQAGRKDAVPETSSLSKASAGAGASTSASAVSVGAASRKTPKGRTLRVACYADDTKEPEFIGEGSVDLTDTLRSGEFDEWVTIKAKDRYAGEVYLELTFYSSAAPPRKRSPLKPTVPANTTYGGAGTFSGDIDSDLDPRPRPPVKQSNYAPIPSTFIRQSQLPSSNTSTQLGQAPLPQSISHIKNMSATSIGSPQHTPDPIPPSLRPSSSLAYIGSYTPPYAAQTLQRSKSPNLPPPPPHDLPERRNSFNTPSHPSFQTFPSAPPPQQRQPSYHEYTRTDVSAFPQPYGSTYSNITQSSSASTIRPGQSRADGGLDDLVGGMSSMSVHSGVGQHGGPQTTDSYVNPYADPSNTAFTSQRPGMSSMPSSQSNSAYNGSIDQFGRPHAHAAGYGHASQHMHHHRNSVSTPVSAPTPPPPPSSAPPSSVQFPPAANGSIRQPAWSPAPLQHAHSYPEHPSYGAHAGPAAYHHQEAVPSTQRVTSPAPYPPPRAVSPAVMSPVGSAVPPPPPPRGHTPGTYYALPQPPLQQVASPSPLQYQQAPQNPPAPQQQNQGVPPHSQNAYTSPLPPPTTLLQSPYARSTSPAPPHVPQHQHYAPQNPSLVHQAPLPPVRPEYNEGVKYAADGRASALGPSPSGQLYHQQAEQQDHIHYQHASAYQHHNQAQPLHGYAAPAHQPLQYQHQQPPPPPPPPHPSLPHSQSQHYEGRSPGPYMSQASAGGHEWQHPPPAAHGGAQPYRSSYHQPPS